MRSICNACAPMMRLTPNRATDRGPEGRPAGGRGHHKRAPRRRRNGRRRTPRSSQYITVSPGRPRKRTRKSSLEHKSGEAKWCQTTPHPYKNRAKTAQWKKSRRQAEGGEGREGRGGHPDFSIEPWIAKMFSRHAPAALLRDSLLPKCRPRTTSGSVC